jgi:hypothetical protein
MRPRGRARPAGTAAARRRRDRPRTGAAARRASTAPPRRPPAWGPRGAPAPGAPVVQALGVGKARTAAGLAGDRRAPARGGAPGGDRRRLRRQLPERRHGDARRRGPRTRPRARGDPRGGPTSRRCGLRRSRRTVVDGAVPGGADRARPPPDARWTDACWRSSSAGCRAGASPRSTPSPRTSSGRRHAAAFDVSIESMEGAAAAAVARGSACPFAELRAVSNLVGERDRARGTCAARSARRPTRRRRRWPASPGIRRWHRRLTVPPSRARRPDRAGHGGTHLEPAPGW